MIFNLVQHKADRVKLDADFLVRLEPNQNSIHLNYRINGNLENLILPVVSKDIKRADNLWQNTCFEAFLKLKDSSAYLELNLSPFSAYNLYYFDSYRQGMSELGIADIKLDALKEENKYQFIARVELAESYAFEAVSITAILMLNSGETSHWAIKHPAPKPDFHLPDSFIAL